MPERLQGERWITSHQKRVFDIAVSSTLLPIAIPTSCIGAAAFFLETHVNPLFIQSRLGRRNEPLSVIRLRTMPFGYDLADSSNGHTDERASRIGRILRKSTLDEAPQAVNILAGKMSVVGPRPLVNSDVEKTMDLLNPSEQIGWEQARSVAKPGWLSEFGNASRSLEPQSDEYLLTRVEMDRRYLETASFDTDVRIIRDALAIGAFMIKD